MASRGWNYKKLSNDYEKVEKKRKQLLKCYFWLCSEEKSSFKIMGLTFSSKLDWDSYSISIFKAASKKIGALIRSMKFIYSGVAMYLYKSTIHLCMEYCCHLWTGTPCCYLELLVKLQKWICGTVSPSLLLLWNPWLIVEMWPT